MKVNNGILIQFGTYSSTNNTAYKNLPTSYSNTIYSIVTSVKSSADPKGGIQSACAKPYTISQFGCYLDWLDTTATLTCYFLSIGY